MFPLASLLTKGSVKESSANNAKNRFPGPHPSVGLLVYLLFLCHPLILSCLVPLTERGFFPLSQSWGYAGPVPAMLPPPVPWGIVEL